MGVLVGLRGGVRNERVTSASAYVCVMRGVRRLVAWRHVDGEG